jgi:hypothetical protein
MRKELTDNVISERAERGGERAVAALDGTAALQSGVTLGRLVSSNRPD